uniref:Uncharacterized protein n=1 Tax=Glossina morsitans morsitans TaxID=37546 RepID=A0A1B0FC15_GLOMM
MEENSNKAKMHSPISERMGFVALMILQIILFMLFAVFVRYGKAALPAEVPGLFQEHVSKYPRSMQNFLYNYYWLLWYFNIEFQARPYVVRAEIFEYYSYEC